MSERAYRTSRKGSKRQYQGYIALIILGIIIAPALPFLAPANAASSSIALEETEFQFFVAPVSPKLPADGNSYFVTVQLQDIKNGNPFQAPDDLAITIISSDPSVIALPQGKMILAKGESMLKAEILTKDKAGIASITALAEGVKPSTASLTTYIMDSLEPTRLAIYAAPRSFLPNPEYVGMIYLQLLNSQNLPSTSKSDISVDLSSSEGTVGRVPSYVVIPAGKSGVEAGFTPQKQTGETLIRASAPGLAPADLTVNVAGPIASKLIVDFAPDIVPAVNYFDAMMTVQLSDDAGNPVIAAKNLDILLKSSDTSVAQVPQSVEIPAGKSYALTFLQSKGKIGVATITAAATGYETGFNDIQAVELSSATTSDPKVLRLYSVPRILPPDNSEHQAIVAAFLDHDGKPYRQTGWLYSRMALSTSNTQVGEITSTSFTTKETYAIAKFKTNYAIGETILTASLEGYAPAQTTLDIEGSGPAAVMLTQIPTVIEANSFGSQSLVLSLADHDGEPVAAQEDTTVYLSSANPEIAKVEASATIKAGESQTITNVHVTLRAGETTITGAADGLASGSVEYRTVGFTGSISEYHLGLYSIPKLPADGREYEALVVQLQDRTGLPVLAKSDVPVSLSSSSGVAGSVQEQVVIPAGSSLVPVIFKTSVTEDKDFKITASSQGFTSVEAEIETTVQPMLILKDSRFPDRLNFGEEVRVAVQVFSGADPLRDAIVTITGTNANETIAISDENGQAEGLYIPTLPGSNSIIVKANKPGFKEAILTSRITLLQTVNVRIIAETQAGQQLTAQMKVQGAVGTKTQTAKPGSPIKFDNAKWGDYKVTAPEQIKTANADFNFVGWSDGVVQNPRTWSVIGNTEIIAVYKAKYLLQITDPNGIANGQDYYDEGTTATITMPQTSIGGTLIDKNFVGWSGDIRSSSAIASVLMDSPKTIKAEWADSYLKIALIIGGAAGGGFVYYWKILKPKKEMEEKQRAPDLDWYKS